MSSTAKRRPVTPIRIRLSLLDLLAATSGIALIMFAGSLRPESGAFAMMVCLGLSLLAVGLCYWLRRRPFFARALRSACVLLMLLVIYILSLGPAIWLMTSPALAQHRTRPITTAFYRVYGPVGVVSAFAPDPLHAMCLGYLRFWLPQGHSLGDHGWGIRLTIDGNMGVLGS